MAAKSQLPLKVIKHWFRNTLFKERQRNKDSPYNFNNPPSTYLNLEEYEKTGETKVQMIEDCKLISSEHNKEENSSSSTEITPVPSNSGKTTPQPPSQETSASLSNIIKIEPNEIKTESMISSEEDEEKSIKQENSSNLNISNLNNQNIIDNLAQQNVANLNNIQQFLAAMAAQSQQQLLQSQLNGLGNLSGFNNLAAAVNSNSNQNEQQNQHSALNSNQNNNESMKSFGASPHSDDSMDSIATNDTSSQPNMQIYSGLQFANLPGKCFQ